MPNKYADCDFHGWATKYDLRCSDGKTIRQGAFSHQNGQKVPIVWGHQHDAPDAVLGHGFLENRNGGTYIYGYLNETPMGKLAKQELQHGDLFNLSIWANKLQQNGNDVLHGQIREVSLVLAGANPGASIEYVAHGEFSDEVTDEAIISLNEDDAIVHTGIPDEYVQEPEETISHEEEGDNKMAEPEKKTE